MEKIGLAPLSATTGIETYNLAKDIASLTTSAGRLFEARPGEFFIFFPDDAHHPGIRADASPAPVKKIVVKIRATPSVPGSGQ